VSFPARRRPHTAATSLLLAASLVAQGGCGLFRRSNLPEKLTGQQFWNLITDLSEPPGSFTHSDNVVSNEIQYADVMRTLRPRGGVYIGVGPEQNLSYIAEVRPAMAFIVDVRIENRSLHLLYKALFEISTDRADFVSRLFSRERPAGLDSATSVEDLFAGYASVQPQRRLREENGRLIRERLLATHRFPLSSRELGWIDYVLDAFYSDGPDIHYARLLPNDPRGPSYRALMTARDVSGQHRSYLSSEGSFSFLKSLHTANLIVPIVGDFGGPSALKATGEYVRQHRQIITTFYSSNVEVYLNREKTVAFCRNLMGLPHDWNTYFVWSKGKQPLRLKLAACAAR
jgi:hypothetical protein